VDYDERLRVPLRWWVQTTMFLASLWLAFVVALPPSVAFAATAALGLLAGALLVGYGNARLIVGSGTFTAGKASIPLSLLAEPVALGPEAAHRLAGRDANTRAYHLLRPYVKTAVRVTVTDPADPVPYWLVSSRHPEALASALAAAVRATSRD
jgi:hypothetical protein